jgi:hypothetical protein
MTSLGFGNYVVDVLSVGGLKASDIKLLLQREPRTGKSWFLAASISPYEKQVDAAVRELLAENGLTLIVLDLTLVSGNHLRVPLPARKYSLICVLLAYVSVPYVTANQRTRAKLEEAINTMSTVHINCSYVVPTTVDFSDCLLRRLRLGSLRILELAHFSIEIVIEIEVVHSEPASMTGSHLTGPYTQPYMTDYEQVEPGFSSNKYTYRHTYRHVCRRSLGVKNCLQEHQLPQPPCLRSKNVIIL